MNTLLYTGPLVAAADRSDKNHVVCSELLGRLARGKGRLLVPSPVVVEVCWLVEKFRGPEAEADFLELVSAGELELVEIIRADVRRMAEFVRRYADFLLGVVDAAVITLAERLGVRQVATLDRRHFSVVRPRHIEALTDAVREELLVRNVAELV
ncbi:type II toxin-antitoxin system VapC family toxin, partial [Frankia sp. Cr1]|uniref:type II toxin-antitoxin system VapC family toxin n=1 Tax=Frankia sp. Cr1 TaxID=3073931 RepID=UPI002AD4B57B